MGEVGGTFDQQRQTPQNPRDQQSKLGQRQSVDANQRPVTRTVLEEVKERRVIQSAGKPQGWIGAKRHQQQSQTQVAPKSKAGGAKPPSSSGLVSVKSQTQSMKDLHQARQSQERTFQTLLEQS